MSLHEKAFCSGENTKSIDVFYTAAMVHRKEKGLMLERTGHLRERAKERLWIGEVR